MYLSHPRKIFDADCTTSYLLNSGVTEPNLTKFLQVYKNDSDYSAEIKIAIFQIILECPKMTNEDRRQKLRVLA